MDKTISTVVKEALERGEITAKRANFFYDEIDDFSFELALRFNHNASTSLHKTELMRILDTINYLLMHGFKSNHCLYSILKDKTIKDIFYEGLQCVEKDAETIKKMLDIERKNHLSFENDRYKSIIYEQVPRFLETLQEDNAIFNYCYVEPDLDYPLFDGIPLYHDMYHLQGTDLVLFYLERFSIENQFCFSFNNQLPKFIKNFEDLKGISIEYLSINLFEILLYQIIAHILLYDNIGIFLEERDVIRLKTRLQHISSIETTILETLYLLNSQLPNSIGQYIIMFKNDIMTRFRSFVYEEYELLIYSLIDQNNNIFILNDTHINDDFFKDLESLQLLSKTFDKINFLKSKELSIYDLFDLLENDIFFDKEYELFFSSLTLEEIAIIIKIQIPEAFVFNKQSKLNEELYKEFNCNKEWKIAFLNFLKNCSLSQKEEIERNLNNIRIIEE